MHIHRRDRGISLTKKTFVAPARIWVWRKAQSLACHTLSHPPTRRLILIVLNLAFQTEFYCNSNRIITASARLLRLSAGDTQSAGSQHSFGLIMCPGFHCPSPAVFTLLPLFEIKFLFTNPVYTIAQHGLQNEGHAEMPDFPASISSLCQNHEKSVIQVLLYYFFFCCLIAGGLMVFSVILMVSSFKADDDTDDSVSAG